MTTPNSSGDAFRQNRVRGIWQRDHLTAPLPAHAGNWLARWRANPEREREIAGLLQAWPLLSRDEIAPFIDAVAYAQHHLGEVSGFAARVAAHLAMQPNSGIAETAYYADMIDDLDYKHNRDVNGDIAKSAIEGFRIRLERGNAAGPVPDMSEHERAVSIDALTRYLNKIDVLGMTPDGAQRDSVLEAQEIARYLADNPESNRDEAEMQLFPTLQRTNDPRNESRLDDRVIHAKEESRAVAEELPSAPQDNTSPPTDNTSGRGSWWHRVRDALRELRTTEADREHSLRHSTAVDEGVHPPAAQLADTPPGTADATDLRASWRARWLADPARDADIKRFLAAFDVPRNEAEDQIDEMEFARAEAAGEFFPTPEGTTLKHNEQGQLRTEAATEGAPGTESDAIRTESAESGTVSGEAPTWQDKLRAVDADLARSRIDAVEHRRLADDILAAVSTAATRSDSTSVASAGAREAELTDAKIDAAEAQWYRAQEEAFEAYVQDGQDRSDMRVTLFEHYGVVSDPGSSLDQLVADLERLDAARDASTTDEHGSWNSTFPPAPEDELSPLEQMAAAEAAESQWHRHLSDTYQSTLPDATDYAAHIWATRHAGDSAFDALDALTELRSRGANSAGTTSMSPQQYEHISAAAQQANATTWDRISPQDHQGAWMNGFANIEALAAKNERAEVVRRCADVGLALADYEYAEHHARLRATADGGAQRSVDIGSLESGPRTQSEATLTAGHGQRHASGLEQQIELHLSALPSDQRGEGETRMQRVRELAAQYADRWPELEPAELFDRALDATATATHDAEYREERAAQEQWLQEQLATHPEWHHERIHELIREYAPPFGNRFDPEVISSALDTARWERIRAGDEVPPARPDWAVDLTAEQEHQELTRRLASVPQVELVTEADLEALGVTSDQLSDFVAHDGFDSVHQFRTDTAIEREEIQQQSEQQPVFTEKSTQTSIANPRSRADLTRLRDQCADMYTALETSAQTPDTSTLSLSPVNEPDQQPTPQTEL